MADTDRKPDGDAGGDRRKIVTEAQRAILARGREELARKRAAGTLGRDRKPASEVAGEPIEPTDLERNREPEPDPGNVGGGNGGAGGSRGGGWGRWFGSRAELAEPAKRKHRATGAKAPLDLSGIEAMLHSCFLVMSIRAGAHWEISPQEAKKLSDAVARVARHYPVVSSQKGADWAQLMLVVGTIGVPRAVQSWESSPSTPSKPSAPSQPATQAPIAAAPFPAAPNTNGAAPPRIETPSQLDPAAMAHSHVTAS